MKRKLEAEHASFVPNKEQKINLSSIEDSKTDTALSLLWWEAAKVALSQDENFLVKLVKAPDKNLNKIDWNFSPNSNDLYHGINLAFLAFILYLQNKKILLNELLSAPKQNLVKLEWNSSPDDKNHGYHGVTLAWLVAYLSYEEKEDDKDDPIFSDIFDILSNLSDESLKKLNWDACPESGPLPSITFAWLIAIQAHGLVMEGNENDYNIFKLLLKSPEEIKIQNWNVYLRSTLERNQNITLAWFAAEFVRYSYPKFFNKLLNSSSTILETLKWNSCPLSDKYYMQNVSLAFQLVMHIVADKRKKNFPNLPEIFFSLPLSIFQQLNWNSGPDFDDGWEYYGVSLAWMATYFLIEFKDCRLFKKLVDSYPTNLHALHWNAQLKYDEKPENLVETYRGVNLARMAAEIAHPKNVPAPQPGLLEILLNSPLTILEGINWNDHHGLYDSNDSLFARILTTIPSVLHPKYCRILFQPEILSKLVWDDSLIKRFIELMDYNLLEMYQVFPSLPSTLLNSLQKTLEESKDFNETVCRSYLKFLREFTETGEISAETVVFLEANPLKLLTGYQNIHYKNPCYREAQFQLSSWYLAKDELSPAELKNSVISDIKYESPRQVKLANAFYHACHGYLEDKSQFVFRLIKEIFSSDNYSLAVTLPESLQKNAKIFLKNIKKCDDPVLLPLIIERFRSDIQHHRLIREIGELCNELNQISPLLGILTLEAPLKSKIKGHEIKHAPKLGPCGETKFIDSPETALPIEVLCTAPAQPFSKDNQDNLIDISSTIFKLITLEEKYQIPDLLKIRNTYLNWNARKDDCTLALIAILLHLSPMPVTELLEILINTPKQRLTILNWNTHFSGANMACWAARLALKRSRQELLTLLLELPDENFKILVLDAGESHSRECSLFCWAVELAITNQPKLLRRLLTLPSYIINQVDWNLKISINSDRGFVSSCLAEISAQTMQEAVDLIIHPTILSRLNWEDTNLQREFCNLAAKNLPTFDTALSKLPLTTLNFLREIFGSESRLSQYTDFLIEIKSGVELTPKFIDFCKENPLKSSAGYFAAAAAVPDKMLNYYLKVSSQSPFYPLAREKVVEVYLKSAKSYLKPLASSFWWTSDSKENLLKTQSRLMKALEHALKWFHYNIQQPVENKKIFIHYITKKIFLMTASTMDYPDNWKVNLEDFLTYLTQQKPTDLNLEVDIFIQKIISYKLIQEKSCLERKYGQST